jgi:hypothetical protein
LSDDFRAGLADTISLYGQGNVSARIKTILKSTARIRGQKRFFDIRHDY